MDEALIQEAAVMRLANVLAVQAEIEGMKAENKQREIEGNNLTFTSDMFQEKAEDLRNWAYCHRDQIMGL